MCMDIRPVNIENSHNETNMYHENRSVFSEIHLPMDYSNNNTPRPITNASLRRSLEDVFDHKLPPIAPKDEKILSLLVQRGESEKSYWENMHKNAVEWDRASSERNERILKRNRLHREHIAQKRDEERQLAYMRMVEQQKRRQKIRAAMMNDIYQAQEDVENVLRRNKTDDLQKFIENNRKVKKHQENNWWKVNNATFERKTEDLSEHEENRSNAVQRRDTQLDMEVARMSKENKEERRYFMKRLTQQERRAAKNREAINESLERKLQQAQANHEHELKRKEEAIKRAIAKEEERRACAKQSQDKAVNGSVYKATDQLTKSSKGSRQSKKQQTKRSKEIVKRIHMDTDIRRNRHTTNTDNLRKELKKWTKELRIEIRDGEKRMEDKQEERQNLMETSRSRAYSSSNLRGRLHHRYGMENFDRKVLRVQSFHSLGDHRPPTALWNDSSNISLL